MLKYKPEGIDIMLSVKNKTVALILYIFLTLFSWILVFSTVFYNIFAFLFSSPPLEVGLFSFTLITIFLTIYTLTIIFKINASAYAPVLIGLFHLSSLSNSSFLFFFLIIDLVVLVLLNISSGEPIDYKNASYYQFGTNPFENKKHQDNSGIQDGNVFDAEYKEHEDK